MIRRSTPLENDVDPVPQTSPAGREREVGKLATRGAASSRHGRGVLDLRDPLAAVFKQFGVGLATAILIDATIVRAVLLPASMKLLGDWNWYLPRWLQWLPRLEHRESGAAPELEPASV